LAHFDTDAGRKLLFGKSMFVKIALLAVVSFLLYCTFYDPAADLFGLNSQNLLWILPFVFLAYVFEGGYAAFSFLKKKAKIPEITSKIIFTLPVVFVPMVIVAAVFAILFTYKFSEYAFYDIGIIGAVFAFTLLLIDLLTPFWASFIVLLLQPITVIMRNRIIKRAVEKRKKFENLLAIGITGSFGKSSVKEFLKTILSESFSVAATEKNKNSEMGVSEAILDILNDKHEIFICEMGAYNRGGIRLLTTIAAPKIGVLTGIGNQHLATFGSQDNIVKAKFELIDALPEEGLAVLNWDNGFIRKNFDDSKNSIKYGIDSRQDVWAEDIDIQKHSVSFKVVFKTGEEIKIKANLIGAQNVINLVGAIAIARRLGMENQEIIKGVEKIKSNQGGLDLVKGERGFYIANSSYSMNIAGALAHLDYLKLWNQKKIFVMPCLIELGRTGAQSHYELGKKIGSVCDNLIVVTPDYFGQIKKGVMESGMKEENISLIENPEAQYQKIIKAAKPDDIVFLEGRVPDYLVKKLIRPVK
jgi:UDP-N-acetylmuramoyl-tripeptide--D-alanyl-D-alanine ligase